MTDKYFPGAAYDSILFGNASDIQIEKMPEPPKGLVAKTLKATCETIDFELARNPDPNSREFKKALEEFTDARNFGNERGLFQKVYDWFLKN